MCRRQPGVRRETTSLKPANRIDADSMDADSIDADSIDADSIDADTPELPGAAVNGYSLPWAIRSAAASPERSRSTMPSLMSVTTQPAGDRPKLAVAGSALTYNSRSGDSRSA
jgi:hypothetical protein